MAGFNFANRKMIERVIRLTDQASESGDIPGRLIDDAERFTRGWIFKTPVGGIAARSGTACGSAACTPYYINSSGTITELTNDAGASQTVTVYNIFGSAIGAEVYVTAKECNGALVADAEDCA